MTAQNVGTAREHPHEQPVHVTVSYLPATHPFAHRLDDETTAETVRAEAMAFFHVSDRQERDTYRYFLELLGTRIVDTAVTLEYLLGEHHHEGHELHFHLIEEITPGSE
jgi:hypothetical protein